MEREREQNHADPNGIGSVPHGHRAGAGTQPCVPERILCKADPNMDRRLSGTRLDERTS
jgi:hypothetical protein